MSNLVHTGLQDGVAVVTIDNPPVNALSPAVWAAIDDVFGRTAATGRAAVAAAARGQLATRLAAPAAALDAIEAAITMSFDDDSHGFGFPRHRGGPMFYADTIGLPVVLRRVEAFRARLGDHWKPAPLLARLAAEGRGFHDSPSPVNPSEPARGPS